MILKMKDYWMVFRTIFTTETMEVYCHSKGYIYESGLNVPLVVRIPENLKLSPFKQVQTSTFVELLT